MASVITAITTALLTTVISLAVQIGVGKYHPKFRFRGTLIGSKVNQEEQLYDDIFENKGCVAMNDYSKGETDGIYMEIGKNKKGEAVSSDGGTTDATYTEVGGNEGDAAMKDSKSEIQLEKNEAYAIHRAQ